MTAQSKTAGAVQGTPAVFSSQPSDFASGETCAPASSSQPTGKEFSTAKACFALKGRRLIRCTGKPGDNSLVISWAWPRYCKDSPALRAFLDQIGGRA